MHGDKAVNASRLDRLYLLGSLTRSTVKGARHES
jgi:hypothetical protein